MTGSRLLAYTTISVFAFPFLYTSGGGSPSSFSPYNDKTGTITVPIPEDTTKKDTTKLPYPFHDRLTDQYSNSYDNSPLYGTDPSNINSSVEYNPETREYDINERMGDEFYRNPSYMTFEEFKEDQFKNSTKKYWKDRSEGEDAITRKPLIPLIYVAGEGFDRIFGGNTIDIRPQGSAKLRFGVMINKMNNPQIPEKQRRNSTFDFDMEIQMNVIGNIGDKLKLSVNYNTEASFDFENQMKIEYTGYEDEIIRKIEAGNVSLPLNSTLIQGSQSLFGIKAQLQYGRLGVTTVYSQQKGQASTINVPPGGGQINNFEIPADQYEANRHFYISQYFREHYDQALANLPTIASQVTITKMEVWVTQVNFNSNDNTRNLLALQDLGEYNPYNRTLIGQGTSVLPSDSLSNTLYNKMKAYGINVRNFSSTASTLDPLASLYNFAPQQDYEIMANAKKLSPTEFYYNDRLGFISLNSELRNDQALAVAFEYTVGNKVYRVGELTTTGVDAPNVLILKLLRGRNFNTALPTWRLMMKNVYNLNSFQISKEKFRLDVLYYDNTSGNNLRQLPEGSNEPNVSGKSLIRVLNLDNLNSQGDASVAGDGVFDYSEGITISSNSGRIIFPAVEPFGRYLESKFVNQTNANKYIFKELYDSTKTIALAQGKNRFTLKGTYQSSSGSEISLNAINIPQGSVKVTSGGVPLVENQDYTVDYNLGRVKIINSSVLNSATPVQVSLESNSLFAIQSKTLFGTRFDYKFSNDFTLGGTFLHLNERPITQKVNVGDEPISNSIFGIDGTYKTDSRFITKLVDKLPFINTKEMSSVSLVGEFAYLQPGHSAAIGKKGNAYIDDFEGTQSTIDIKNAATWSLASVPRFQSTAGMFPEFDYVANTGDTLGYGYNRAKLAWYSIDPTVFYRNNGSVTVSDDELSNHNVREISEKELFPNREFQNGQVPTIQVLNLDYYPDERGPYNYETGAKPNISAGTDLNTGKLVDPSSRWGGIMRRLETNNFEEANVQYIQFWMMDPFNGDAPDDDLNNTGTLYFNLGDVSEDILRDGYQSYENGLPTADTVTQIRTNVWGRTPTVQNILYAFTDGEAERKKQDVGIDGLSNADEQVNFGSNFLSLLSSGLIAFAYTDLENDPSSDNYHYFRGDDLDAANAGILTRYKNYNGMEGNSPVSDNGNYISSATQIPDAEDANRQSGMEVDENYFQYKVEIDPAQLVVGQNYVADALENIEAKNVRNQTSKKISWYLVKIPVNDVNRQKFGQISDLKSVKFIRMFAKGFNKPIVLRFARLELLRGEWRKYDYDLASNSCANCAVPSTFDVGAVSLEENGDRDPINYVLPPDFERETDITSTNQRQLNEQSLSIRMCELKEGDLRMAYKTTKIDMRNYKHVKMVIHAEAFKNSLPNQIPEDGDLYAVIRLGSDFKDNYYEYRIPLKISQFGNNDPYAVWPTENNFDIDLDRLTQAKLNRNNTSTPLSQEYYEQDGNNLIYIKGNPTLSEVKTMMLGVWNPAEPFEPNNDPFDKCVEIWFNEFRMNDFNEKGGWASVARAQIKLADLGNVSVSGGHSTHGFGSLESKVSDRTKEDVTTYDVATSIELGKFFPTSTGLTIPLYFGYGEVFSNPQFDPLDPDIEFTRSLNNINDATKKDNRKRISQDYTRRKSLNFTNVRKNKTGKNASKTHIYDVENLNFTYGYTEIYHRNVTTEFDLQKDYLGAVGYNYTITPKGITPFSKMKTKSKYARPIKDFNFNLLPSNFNFRWDVVRHLGQTQLRDISNSDAIIPATYDKNFTMGRQYGLSWDITKSIKFEFNANNLGKIDEPEGALDTQEKKDSVRKNFYNLGRNVDYMHDGSLSYNLPLSKFPLTDWMNVTARYGATYHWTASPLSPDPSSGNFYLNSTVGNTVQNSNTKQLNTSLNMTTLYNKFKFYKKITAPPKPKVPKEKKPGAKEAKAPKDSSAVDSSKTKVKAPVPVKKKETEYSPAFKTVAKLFFGLKNVSVNWSETNGLLLPGFTKQSELMGQNWSKEDGKNVGAPGFAFTTGSQDQAIRYRAAQHGWLTTDTMFNSQFTSTYQQNITGRASVEPVSDLVIDINATRNYSLSTSENYRATPDGKYNPLAHTENGNYSMSYFTWNTAFTKDRKDYTSSIFETFAANRQIISQRLAAENGNSVGADTSNGNYRDGYGPTEQNVIILSFLAAYTKKNPSKSSLDLFPKIPKPNWTIRYGGLSKLPGFKNIFQNITLNHAYRSTYNVNAFTTDVSYVAGGNVRDASNNFIPGRQIAGVSLSEQFSPLIGIDITWKNKKNNSTPGKKGSASSGGGGNITTRIEFKRDRNISLALAGIQVTEVKGKELTIGAGYRIPNFKMPIKALRNIASRKANELNLTLDFSIRKNTTVLRKLVENTNQATAGLTVISIDAKADYTVNERLNLSLYFKKTINTPVISTSYPSSATLAGIEIRFTLSQ